MRGAGNFVAPREFSASVISMDICKKSAFIFGELGMALQKEFADGLYQKLRSAVREKLIDFGTMTATGNCQTTQAMAIFYDVFEPGEKQAAVDVLVKQIEKNNKLLDVGILGGRVIFHVLSAFGRTDLAYEMMTTETYPSYGNWVKRGATSLWEAFHPGEYVSSLNHHFWGDISGWFIKWLGGIRLNPHQRDVNEVNITPKFIDALDEVKAYHDAPAGRVSVAWRRGEDGHILLDITVPEHMTGRIFLENPFVFDDGFAAKPLAGGSYKIVAK